jgi:hypothetical protein
VPAQAGDGEHALAATTREALARPADEPLVVTASLPMTVTARRNARLRAAALATIPFWLILLAAIPRVWEPDLVPFGEYQAAYVSEAIRRAPVSWLELYTDPSVPLLAFIDPLLRELPSPLVTWVVLRGLLDAIGVGLLYLAARSLVGTWPALLASVLYGANPLAWAATRDPAGALGAVVAATTLLASGRFIRRRTVARGVVLGAVLLLIVVPAVLRCGIDPQAGWPSDVLRAVPPILTVMFAVVPFLLVLPLASRRRAVRWGGMSGAALLGLAVVGLTTSFGQWERASAPFSTLRDWSAVASAVRETAGRTDTQEVVVPGASSDVEVTARLLRALLRTDVLVREAPVAALLPLERETVFLFLGTDVAQPVELRRTSSLMMVATPDGTDTGARIATLRPRSAADWLARVDVVADGAFADGSRLLGLTTASRPGGGPDVTLYWQLPVSPTGPASGERIAVGLKDALRGRPATAALLPLNARRDGEIVVQVVRLLSIPGGSGAETLQVTVYDGQRGIVRTASGAESLDVPLAASPR